MTITTIRNSCPYFYSSKTKTSWIGQCYLTDCDMEREIKIYEMKIVGPWELIKWEE